MILTKVNVSRIICTLYHQYAFVFKTLSFDTLITVFCINFCLYAVKLFKHLQVTSHQKSEIFSPLNICLKCNCLLIYSMEKIERSFIMTVPRFPIISSFISVDPKSGFFCFFLSILFQRVICSLLSDIPYLA